MRAVVAPRLGGAWEVKDWPEPTPGPDDLLVRIEASGICRTDIDHLHCAARGATFPRVPGHEPVGTVLSVGENVRHLNVGDRVGCVITQHWCGTCRYCIRGRHEMCEGGARLLGATADGGHAELALIDSASAERLPPGLDPVQAAPIFCAGYTVYSALCDADVRPGERVAVVGVGGLGHLAVQYANALGAEVVAVTRSADKVPVLRGLGAHEVVVASAAGSRLLRMGGIDVAVLCGNSVDRLTLEALRPYGRVSLCGATKEAIPATARDMIFRKLTIFGSSHGPRHRLREALDLFVRARLRTVVEDHPLEQALHAYDRVESGRVRFRAVLIPSH